MTDSPSAWGRCFGVLKPAHEKAQRVPIAALADGKHATKQSPEVWHRAWAHLGVGKGREVRTCPKAWRTQYNNQEEPGPNFLVSQVECYGTSKAQ